VHDCLAGEDWKEDKEKEAIDPFLALVMSTMAMKFERVCY